MLKNLFGKNNKQEEKVRNIIVERNEEENSIWGRLKKGLKKTQREISSKFEGLFFPGRVIDDDFYEELEEILVLSDIGIETAGHIVEELREYVLMENIKDEEKIKRYICNRLGEMLSKYEGKIEITTTPFVIMVVGVNGVGKTTTIGKLASRFLKDGKKVMLAAGDTFRAAADTQLGIWGERSGVEVVRGREGADPSSVAYDAVTSAVSKKVDVLIVDTAGRMHIKKNLMEELKKMKRVLGKALPGAPNEVLLVLDATTGQNALSQTKMFMEAVDVTGIIMTKLDGTAKGGVLISIALETEIPIKFIGVGEDIESLQPFNGRAFAEAIIED
ncbi:MAG: signal recognition particle-docking protein FtsY [Candidatus Schekmanbacteria bacterium]|nr:MAG: signal recognition particle-docking protein FtsY [Candidatus Schekmanbacteria bacterium]